MTDIDALLREANAWQDRYSPSRDKDAEILIGELVDALTTERAKVAALEKENAKFRTMLGGSTALAEGLGIRVDAVMQEVALAAYKQLEDAKAEAARWREAAGKSMEALQRLGSMEAFTVSRTVNMPDDAELMARINFAEEAALTLFKQESGE